MFEADEMSEFFEKCKSAGGGEFKKQIMLFLEGLGLEFLRVIQDEIIRRKVMDTRLLLSSFNVGDGNGIWELSEGGLTLEVGTNVEYAGFVNDGHWTCKKGEKIRAVPGVMKKDKKGNINFEYRKGAKSGIVLKQKWVKGAHYWESGLRIIDKIMPELLDAKLQEWLDSYF